MSGKLVLKRMSIDSTKGIGSDYNENNGKNSTDHLRRCATMMKYHSQLNVRHKFFLRWLAATQRSTKKEWKRCYAPARDVPLPKANDAMALVRRYFSKWKQHNRELLQRRRANVEAVEAGNKDRLLLRAFIKWQSRVIVSQKEKIATLESANKALIEQSKDLECLNAVAASLSDALWTARNNAGAPSEASSPMRRSDAHSSSAAERIREATALAQTLASGNQRTAQQLIAEAEAAVATMARGKRVIASYQHEVEDLRVAAIRAIDALGGRGANNDTFLAAEGETAEQSATRSKEIGDTLRNLCEDMIIVLVLTSMWSNEGASEKVSESLEHMWRRCNVLQSEKEESEEWLGEMHDVITRCNTALDELCSSASTSSSSRDASETATSLATLCKKETKDLSAIGYFEPEKLVWLVNQATEKLEEVKAELKAEVAASDKLMASAVNLLSSLRPSQEVFERKNMSKLGKAMQNYADELIALREDTNPGDGDIVDLVRQLYKDAARHAREQEETQQTSERQEQRLEDLLRQNAALESTIEKLETAVAANNEVAGFSKTVNEENEKLREEIISTQKEALEKESEMHETINRLRSTLVDCVDALKGFCDSTDLEKCSREAISDLEAAIEASGYTNQGPALVIRQLAEAVSEAEKRQADLQQRLRDEATKLETLRRQNEKLTLILRGVESQLLIVAAEDEPQEAEQLAAAAQEAALSLINENITQPMSLLANLSVLVLEAKDVVKNIPPAENETTPAIFTVAELFPLVQQVNVALASRLEKCDSERQMYATLAIFLRDMVRDGIGRVQVVNDSLAEEPKKGDSSTMGSIMLNQKSRGPLTSSSDPSDYVGYILTCEGASDEDAAALQEHMSQNITIGEQDDPSTWDVVAEFHDQLVTLCSRSFEARESIDSLANESEQLRELLETVYSRLETANAESAGDDDTQKDQSEFVNIDDMNNVLAKTERLYSFALKSVSVLDADGQYSDELKRAGLGETLFNLCVHASELVKETKKALGADFGGMGGEGATQKELTQLMPMLKTKIEELLQAKTDSEALVKSLDNVWNDTIEDGLASSTSSVVTLKSLKPKKKPMPALENDSNEGFVVQHSLKNPVSTFSYGSSSSENRIKALRRNARDKIDEVQALAATCRSAIALLEGCYGDGSKLPHYESLNTALTTQVEELKQGLAKCNEVLGPKENVSVGSLLSSMSSMVMSLQLERDSLREQLNGRMKQNTLLLDDLNAATAKHAEAEEQAQARIEKLQTTNAQLQQRLESQEERSGNISAEDAESFYAHIKHLRVQLRCIRNEVVGDLDAMLPLLLNPIREALEKIKDENTLLRQFGGPEAAAALRALQTENIELKRGMRDLEIENAFLVADADDAGRHSRRGHHQQLVAAPTSIDKSQEISIQNAAALVVDALHTLSGERLAKLFSTIAEDATLVHHQLQDSVYSIMESWARCSSSIVTPQLREFDEVMQQQTEELQNLSIISQNLSRSLPALLQL